MECKSSAYWLVICIMITARIFVVGQIEGGCIEEERNALLEIKASAISFGYDPADYVLPTWVNRGSNGSSDESCCAWERVTCNITTGHVRKLSLGRIWVSPYITLDRTWSLNFSVFLNFKELMSLDLSGNYLDNGIENAGLERLSSLKKLEILDLSFNPDMNPNSIFHSLGALNSLRILDLSHTGLGGYFPAQEIAALENLEMLGLNGNNFYGTFQTQGFKRFSELRKLETLNLRGNQFNESLIASLSALPISLKALNLKFNKISGSFLAQELVHLSNLEKLDLSYNKLYDIQDCKSLSRLKRLESIALGNNYFNSSIISCLSALPSLKNLNLQMSFMLGSSFPTQELSSLRKLEKLDLSFCGLDSVAFNGLPHLPHLKVLFLHGNRFNETLPIEGLRSEWKQICWEYSFSWRETPWLNT